MIQSIRKRNKMHNCGYHSHVEARAWAFLGLHSSSTYQFFRDCNIRHTTYPNFYHLKEVVDILRQEKPTSLTFGSMNLLSSGTEQLPELSQNGPRFGGLTEVLSW